MKLINIKDCNPAPVSHNPEMKKYEMIKYLEIPHLAMFSQVILKPGQTAAEHSHDDMYEIFFIEQGSGVIEVNKRQIKVENGSCLIIEPNEIHKLINNSSDVLIITYFGIVKG